MSQKWIISKIDNTFKLGEVTLHRQLLSGSEKGQCMGGGYYIIVDDENLLLYSSSSDFGQVTEKEFKKMNVTIGVAKRYKKIYFSTKEWLNLALEQYGKNELPFIDLEK